VEKKSIKKYKSNIKKMKNTSKYKGNELKYLKLVLDKKLPKRANSWCQKLEEEFAKKYKKKYAVSFNSGTSTLHAALIACGVKPGDEVISPALTVIMDTSATIHAHAIPVYADVNENDFTISPEEIEKKITKKTKAIIVVSIAGQSPKMEIIKKIALKHKIKIIEDNAQSSFSTYKKKLIGHYGDISSFSFENSKHLSCGEGGITITNNPTLAKTMRKIGNHGFIKLNQNSNSIKFKVKDLLNPNLKRHDEIGWNYRMPEFSAAIALAQLEKAKKLGNLRIQSANYFLNVIRQYPDFFIPQKTYHESFNSYWTVAVRYQGDKNRGISQKVFKKKYLQMGGDIIRGSWSVPYLEPVISKNKFKKIDKNIYKNISYKKGICPVAEKIQKQLMIFKANYRNLKLAKIQSRLLLQTIKSFT
jgi:perosamine synthetase